MTTKKTSSVLMPRTPAIEEASLMIKEYSELLYPIGYTPHHTLKNPKYIVDKLIRMQPKLDDQYKLLDSPEGRMYMMGFIAAVSAFEQMSEDDEEIECFEF